MLPYLMVPALAGWRFSAAAPELTEAEAEAEAYCRQPAGTLTPGRTDNSQSTPYIVSTRVA
jgi:hypothetical protein